jgi:hypothetical protein
VKNYLVTLPDWKLYAAKGIVLMCNLHLEHVPSFYLHCSHRQRGNLYPSALH